MGVLKQLNRALDRFLRWLLASLFAGMIIVVFIQVFARNVLQEPMVWTLDTAQLLFSWCIFLGAALAIRWNAHYVLDLIPERWGVVNGAVRIFAHAASVIVVGVLLYNGVLFAEMGLTRFSPALNLSEMWFFVPIPLSAAAMVLFLAEQIPADIRRILTGDREQGS